MSGVPVPCATAIEKTAHLLLLSVSVALSESLLPASLCAFSSFARDYSVLDDFGQVNSP